MGWGSEGALLTAAPSGKHLTQVAFQECSLLLHICDISFVDVAFSTQLARNGRGNGSEAKMSAPADEELSLPKATIQKMIKDIVTGSDVRVSGDSIDLLVACCTEFVHLVSSQANEVSEKEKRTTVNPEHIITALEELGFSELVAGVREYWEEWKADTKAAGKGAKSKSLAAASGLSEEQQIALQKQLFAAARARSQNQPVDPAIAAATAAAVGGALSPRPSGDSSAQQ